MKQLTCTFVTGLVGLFLFLTGIGFAWFGTKGLIKMWAWEKLTLKNGSEAMRRWIRPPHPTSMNVYIFNVTNPQDVSEGALPIFSEIGPYVYEQSREKVNIIPLENYTYSYQLQNVIKFKQSLSGQLRESDLVTILNVPLAGAILSIYEAEPEFVGLLDDIWRFFYPGQTNIFITTSVKNILFDGITVDCTSKITEVYIGCRVLQGHRSPSIRKEGKNFKFSFFHAKNGTSADTYQVNSGIYDLTKSVQYMGINYSPLINTWNNYYCDMINGSDGTQFPVMLKKTEKLYIFEKELCRSVYAEFEKEINQKGVVLYKFSNTASLFASPEENPDNSCFCRPLLNIRTFVEDEENDEIKNVQNNPRVCLQNGTLPLMPCAGAPIVASFPHFYLGDQNYINYSGLTPVKELHETFVYVEPTSGVAVMGIKRLQFNLEVKRIIDVQITSNLIDGLFPILWVEEVMELSPELFKLLRYSLVEKKVLEYGTFVLIAFGLFLIITAYITRFLKAVECCKGNRKHLMKARDTHITDAHTHGFEAYSQAVSSRLDLGQNADMGDIQIDSIKLQKSEINKFQKNFLIDNFMQ